MGYHSLAQDLEPPHVEISDKERGSPVASARRTMHLSTVVTCRSRRLNQVSSG